MQPQNTFVYIVRLWKEAKNKQPWRGKIQNVQTGQSVSASNMDELMALFHKFFEETESQPKSDRGLK